MSHEFHPEMVASFRTGLAELTAAAAKMRKARDEHLRQARADSEQLASSDGQIADLRYLLRQADPENADEYAEPEVQQLSEREERLRDMRAALEFWETHPDIEVPGYQQISLTGARTLEAVDELAAQLGVQPRDSHGHRIVELSFGSTVYLHASAKLPEPQPEAVAI